MTFNFISLYRFNAEETRRRKRHCSTFHSWKKVLDAHYPTGMNISSQIFDIFFICSANRGDTFDREIDDENRSTKDFLILVSLI